AGTLSVSYSVTGDLILHCTVLGSGTTLYASNVGGVCSAAANTDFAVTSGTTEVDTGSLGSCAVTGTDGSSTCGWHTFVTGGSPVEMCMMKFRSVKIDFGAKLRAFGPHPLVLVATDSLRVSGQIDAAAKGPDPGVGNAFTQPTMAPLHSGEGAGHGALGG